MNARTGMKGEVSMTERIRFGVNVNTRVPVIYPDSFNARQMVDLGVLAEELGYDIVFAGDNFFSKARLESISTLAAIASRTNRVELSTASFIATLRHTVWIALSWATLDQISGGRTFLNVCVGGGSPEAGGTQSPAEFQVAGVPFKKRGKLLEEQIVLLRRLWTEDGVSFDSEFPFHRLSRVSVNPKPARKPCPPIWISSNPQIFNLSGSLVEKMMKRAGTLSDGWMTCTATPEEYKTLWDKVVNYARAAGRDPDRIQPGYQMTLNVNPDRARARREGLEYVNIYYDTTFQALEESMWDRDPFGTPDDCIKKIRGLVVAGVRVFCLRFASHDQFGQIHRFTETVLPAFK